MKRISIIRALALGTALVAPLLTYAADPPSGGGSAIPPITTAIGVLTALENIRKWLYSIFLAIAVIMIVIAAFQFLTAQAGGKGEGFSAAKKSLVYAIIAVAIATLSRAIVAVVQKFVVP